MHPQDSSKLLKTTNSSMLREEVKVSDRTKEIFENHFYEEGVSKF